MGKIIIVGIIAFLIIMVLLRTNTNKASAAKNIELGQAFLAENKKIEGVVETTSGLQYQVLKTGNGSEHPSASSKVKVHYHGTLTDGTVFDSSVDRDSPISFGLNQVISGWTEGVQLMVVGDKTRFFIPSHLAYGNSSTGKIPPGSVLIFDVELLEIQ
ncbi:FKBP-type peptidyl-prolyl cis-trans isomerase [Thalassotalea atypica]|uniref:FKBP-type peptidyl-prolyl cis-trans isomerase n=1 Tax=Thalassotalea atypica TaxID=2054316 RepID=UPI0025726EF4|nr:FKBP-type peptidyl-prolyl cis-trans isomerase [Thalassotalea atypica]